MNQNASVVLLLVFAAFGCSSADSSGGPLFDGAVEDGSSARDATGDGAPGDAGDSSADAANPQDAGDAPSGEAPDAAELGDVADAEAVTDACDAYGAVCPPAAMPLPVSGSITADTSFTSDHVYELSGTVFVESPATLTIADGTTLLMGDGASLLVKPGAKIIAVGTKDLPIVFTSAKPAPLPGDWGTLALIGNAPGNWGLDATGQTIVQHTPDANDWPGGFPVVAGGTNSADSSGTLQYVRLEYGGQPKASVNGAVVSAYHEMLGMYGVGTGTRIGFIDIRQGAFGCLFAEGGAFDATHLICQYGGNTAFGFTRGNQSRVQFLVDQEDPARGAEGLGIKGPFDVNQQPPVTNPTIYNVTVCGSNGSPTIPKDPYGLFMKREPAGHVYNLIASGFRAGLSMQGGVQVDGGIAVASTELRSSILFGNFDPTRGDASATTNIAFDTSNDTDLVAWFTNPQWNNSTNDPGIPGCFNATSMQFAPAAPITTNAATPPATGFFDTSAAYVGALKDNSDTWATGNWVVWASY